jgi:hypothetical protein
MNDMATVDAIKRDWAARSERIAAIVRPGRTELRGSQPVGERPASGGGYGGGAVYDDRPVWVPRSEVRDHAPAGQVVVQEAAPVTSYADAPYADAPYAVQPMAEAPYAERPYVPRSPAAELCRADGRPALTAARPMANNATSSSLRSSLCRGAGPGAAGVSRRRRPGRQLRGPWGRRRARCRRPPPSRAAGA